MGVILCWSAPRFLHHTFFFGAHRRAGTSCQKPFLVATPVASHGCVRVTGRGRRKRGWEEGPPPLEHAVAPDLHALSLELSVAGDLPATPLHAPHHGLRLRP